MAVGRLLLRITVGAIFVEHGTQKLFGWFGGPGLDGAGAFFESLGLRPGRRQAIAAGATEVGGGILLAAGLATPLAATGLSAVMITALRTAVWPDGPKTGTGGYEMLLLASAVALAAEGPGPWSLDARLGIERRGAGWGAATLGAALLASTAVIREGRRHPAPVDTDAAPT